MYCFVMDCKMSCKWKRGPLTPDSNVSFHRFPSDEERFIKWLKAIGVKNTSVISWKYNMYLCSNHFKKEDFLENQPNISPELPNIRKLKSSAIPYLTPLSAEAHSRSFPLKSGSLDKIKKKELERPNPSIIQPQSSIQQNLNVETTDFDKEVPEQFGRETTLATKQLGNQKNSTFSAKLYRPRYMGDVSLSDMENPEKAKWCLVLAKNLLVKQTRNIKQLKNENRVLWRKIDRLRKVAQIAKRKSKVPSKVNETITLLVNI